MLLSMVSAEEKTQHCRIFIHNYTHSTPYHVQLPHPLHPLSRPTTTPTPPPITSNYHTHSTPYHFQLPHPLHPLSLPTTTPTPPPITSNYHTQLPHTNTPTASSYHSHLTTLTTPPITPTHHTHLKVQQ